MTGYPAPAVPPALPVGVSAHASHAPGAESRTIDTYRAAVATGADYVELDIRRTADDELVAFHDERTVGGHPVAAVTYGRLCELAGYRVPTVAEVLTALSGGARGHLDLKDTGVEERLVRLALDILGPGEFVITSMEDASVAAIRARFPDSREVPVALSLGRNLKGSARGARLRTRLSELRPLTRVRACGTDWVAMDHRLAITGVAAACRQQRLKVMVWTVNHEREIAYWLSRQRADVLVTDRPALAVARRDRITPAPADRGD